MGFSLVVGLFSHLSFSLFWGIKKKRKKLQSIAVCHTNCQFNNYKHALSLNPDSLFLGFTY